LLRVTVIKVIFNNIVVPLGSVSAVSFGATDCGKSILEKKDRSLMVVDFDFES